MRIPPISLVILGTLGLAACTDSDASGPEDPEIATLTVDAAQDWAFVTFGDATATPADVATPTQSDGWDMAFFATSVMLNGGAAGPGGVDGVCLCRNGSASDAEVILLTAETEREDFTAVGTADIPADEESWTSDALAAAVDGWYSYDAMTHVVSAAPEAVWRVRTASGTAYAKFHVTQVEDPDREHAGKVTFEFDVQPAAGVAFQGSRTSTVDLSSGPVHFDLETGSAVAADAEWDLLFDGYDIRVNGGVSGGGSAGASLSGESFDAIGDASDLAASHYKADSYGGVFEGSRWYRYNLEGNHQIWPTYDVYLIRRGEAVFKVQLTGYYGSEGDSRQITFRYARIR